MKRALIILMLLPVIGLCENYTISPSIDSLRNSCYIQLGAGVADTDVVDFALNVALEKTCTEYPAYEKLDTIVMTGSGAGASLNADFISLSNYLPVMRMVGDTMWVPLSMMPVLSGDSMFTLEDNTDDRASALSPKYYYVYDERLFVHPKQAVGTDSLLVYYYAMDNKMESGDSTHISTKYIEKLLLYAYGYICMNAGRNTEANMYLAMFYGANRQRQNEVQQ